MDEQEGQRVGGFAEMGKIAERVEAEEWAQLLDRKGVDAGRLAAGEMSAEELGRLVERPADEVLMRDAQAGAQILLAINETRDKAMRKFDN